MRAGRLQEMAINRPAESAVSVTSLGLRPPVYGAPGKYDRKSVRSSLGGEAYAFGEMVDHMSPLREFRAHFMNISPGMMGSEGCESPFARRSFWFVAEKFLVRHFLAIQEALETQEVGNVCWRPGFGKRRPKAIWSLLDVFRNLEQIIHPPSYRRTASHPKRLKLFSRLPDLFA